MTIGELLVRFGLDTAAFSSGFAEINKNLRDINTSVQREFGGIQRAADNLKGVGASLAAAITLPIVGIGAASTRTAADFESSMNRISALGEITGKTLDDLRSQALKLGADTKFSAKEAADGMGELAAAGFDATKITAAMPAVLDLAAAGELAIGSAAEIAANSLQAFGKPAAAMGHLSDVIAKSAASGSLSVLDLGSSLKFVGPLAMSAGLSFEETTAAITLLSNAGVKGEMAGTQLRGMLAALLDPSKEAQKALSRLGVTVSDSAGRMLPFTDIIQQLQEKGAATKDIFQIFTRETASGVQALVNAGAPALREMTRELESSDGAAKKMAETMNTGIKGALERMNGSIETAKIKVGNVLAPVVLSLSGVIDQVADSASGLISEFAKLPASAQTAGLAIAGVGALAGPVLIVVGQLITSFIELRKVLASSVLLGALAGPWGIAAVAATTLAAGVWYVTDAMKRQDEMFGSLVKKTEEVGGQFKATADQARELAGGITVATGSIATLASANAASKEESKKLAKEQKETYRDLSNALKTYFDETIERQSAYAKAISSAQEKVRAEVAKTQLAVMTWNDAMERALRTQVEAVTFWRSNNKILTDLQEAYKQAAGGLREWKDALSTLGISDLNYQLEKQEEALRVIGEATRNGTTDYQLYRDAQLKVLETKEKLGRLTKEEAEAYRKLKVEAGGASKVLQEVSTIINDTSRGIAQAILHWKGFGDVAKRVLDSVGEAILRNVINRLLESTHIVERVTNMVIGLLNQIGKVLGATGQISKIPIKNLSSNVPGLGGDDGDFFPPMPGTSGGGTGGIGGALSGVTGILGAVGSIGSMVSGIIGNFQSARQETTLNAIEHEVRYSQIHLSYILEEVNKYLNFLKPIHDRLFEIRMEGVMVQQNPAWGDFRVAMAGGGSMGGGEVNVSIGTYVGPGGMSQFVDLLVSELRKRGVKFG